MLRAAQPAECWTPAPGWWELRSTQPRACPRPRARPRQGPNEGKPSTPSGGSPLQKEARRGEGEPQGRQPAMAGSVQLSREPRERSPFTPDLRGLGGPALSSGSTPDPREPGSRVKATLGTRSSPRDRHTQEPLLTATGSAPECQGQGFSSDSHS